MKVQPLSLHGKIVRLEPLTKMHVLDLTLAGKDPRIWCYLPYGELTTEERMDRQIRLFLEQAAQGLDLPFAVIYLETNRAIGCTRFLDIDHKNRKVEIGGAWIGVDYQRTRVNTESKYMLLKHAFEVLGCMRVQFKTDARNLRSQAALEHIGAVKEGLLRNHMVLPDGGFRDSVFYSIIPSEWAAVKALLEEKLAGTYKS